MLFRPYSRPFDPTGKAYLNLTCGETHHISDRDSRFFIPVHGPFYTESVVVRSEGILLTLGVDYIFSAPHHLAIEDTGKEVGCVIIVLKDLLRSVTIDYQAVGGKYSEVYQVLKLLSENLGGRIKSPIYWKNISDKPTKFKSSPHMHPFWEFAGWEELTTYINRILQGVLYNDLDGWRHISNYIDGKIAELLAIAGIGSLSNEISYLRSRSLPVGIVMVKYDSIHPGRVDGSSWNPILDRMMAIAGSAGEVGKVIHLDKKNVQLDNALLDDSGVPIPRDDGEWMFLDNEHPVVGTSSGLADPYLAYKVKTWIKTAHGNESTANVTWSNQDDVSSTMLAEGQIAKVVLSTAQFPVGTEVRYRITGLSGTNVSVPLVGKVTLTPNGTATLYIRLQPNGPATLEPRMRVEFLISGGLSVDIPYTIEANKAEQYKLHFVRGISDIIKDRHYMGERLSIMMATNAWKNPNELEVDNVLLDDIGYPITRDDGEWVFLDNQYPTHGSASGFQSVIMRVWAESNSTLDDNILFRLTNPYTKELVNSSGGEVSIEFVPNAGKVWFPIEVTSRGQVSDFEIKVSIIRGTTTAMTASIASSHPSTNFYWVDMNGSPITEIESGRPFRLCGRCDDTLEVLTYTLATTTNSIGSSLVPELLGHAIVVNGNYDGPTHIVDVGREGSLTIQLTASFSGSWHRNTVKLDVV